MRGSDLSGLDDSDIELVQTGGQSSAQGTEPNFVQPGTGIATQGDDQTDELEGANGVATIGTPSAFFKEGFENRYTGAVRSLISDLYAPVSQVRVVIAGESGGSRPGALNPEHHRALRASRQLSTCVDEERIGRSVHAGGRPAEGSSGTVSTAG